MPYALGVKGEVRACARGVLLAARQCIAPGCVDRLLALPVEADGAITAADGKARLTAAGYVPTWVEWSITAGAFEINPMDGTTQIQAWLAAIRRN